MQHQQQTSLGRGSSPTPLQPCCFQQAQVHCVLPMGKPINPEGGFPAPTHEENAKQNPQVKEHLHWVPPDHLLQTKPQPQRAHPELTLQFRYAPWPDVAGCLLMLFVSPAELPMATEVQGSSTLCLQQLQQSPVQGIQPASHSAADNEASEACWGGKGVLCFHCRQKRTSKALLSLRHASLNIPHCLI